MAFTDYRSFERYGKELAAAELVGNVLYVPSGFLGDPIPSLWVHPNYLLLEDFISHARGLDREGSTGTGEEEDTDLLWQFHVVGTPGIGKTYFGQYWMYKQAKLKKRVIWRTKGDLPLFLYYDFSLKNPLVHASPQYIVPAGWHEEIVDVWLVIDGDSKGVMHEGPILQCVCDWAGYHEFSKDLGHIVYLEAWSLDELKQCRDQLDLDFSDEQLEERFYYVGGQPRFIFSKRTSGDLKRMVGNAAACASWKTVVRRAVGDGETFLLHCKLPAATEIELEMPASSRMEYPTLIFGSEYIADKVYRQYERKGVEAARKFFDFCRRIPSAEPLASKFFEKHLHKALRSGGGEYEMKSLNGELSDPIISLKPTSVKTLTMEPDEARSSSGRKRKVVSGSGFDDGVPTTVEAGTEKASSLAYLPANCFVERNTATNKAFDLVTPDIILQHTVSLEHRIFSSEILELVTEYDKWFEVNKQTPPPFYKLIFVVPESNFKDFSFQAYKEDHGDDQPDMSRVKQFAVILPWAKGT